MPCMLMKSLVSTLDYKVLEIDERIIGVVSLSRRGSELIVVQREPIVDGLVSTTEGYPARFSHVSVWIP